MNDILNTRSSNIWIHPITWLNRYLIPIKWLTSLRNKPCTVLQTVSLIVICWVLSLSQPTRPEDAHRVTGTAAALTLFFPWWCVPATGTQQTPVSVKYPHLMPGFLCAPAVEEQNGVVTDGLQVGGLFYEQDRSWCLLVPSLSEFPVFFPLTWASYLCLTAASASSCPHSRAKYWL